VGKPYGSVIPGDLQAEVEKPVVKDVGLSFDITGIEEDVFEFSKIA
jgi:hypothetical protein